MARFVARRAGTDGVGGVRAANTVTGVAKGRAITASLRTRGSGCGAGARTLRPALRQSGREIRSPLAVAGADTHFRGKPRKGTPEAFHESLAFNVPGFDTLKQTTKG
jgi:hypothetical protein